MAHSLRERRCSRVRFSRIRKPSRHLLLVPVIAAWPSLVLANPKANGHLETQPGKKLCLSNKLYGQRIFQIEGRTNSLAVDLMSLQQAVTGTMRYKTDLVEGVRNHYNLAGG